MLQKPHQMDVANMVKESFDVRLHHPLRTLPGHDLRYSPQRIERIPVTEFGVAEWRLPTHNLPRAFDVWVQVECDETVLPEHRRLLAKRRVVLATRQPGARGNARRRGRR